MRLTEADSRVLSTTGEVEAPIAHGKAWWLTTCVLLACAIALLFHARSFLPFISDDALISLRYSERLLNGHGLTWTEGPRVEGYTNLLWVLACAALGLFGADLIEASRIWGYVGMAVAVTAIVYAYRPRRAEEAVGALGGGLAMALAAPIGVWTIGGLEQPFVAAFLAWATVLSFPLIDQPGSSWRDALTPGFLLGLLCLTRSDGGVLCLGLALGIAAVHGITGETTKLISGLAAFPVLMGGGQLIFRLVYYHEWLPNPARVKVAFTPQRLGEGLHYLGDAVPYLGALMIPAVAAIVVGLLGRGGSRRTSMLGVQLIAWLAYVAIIGGDIFPARRHWVPAIVIAAMLVADLAQWLSRQGGTVRLASWVGTGTMLVLLVATQQIDPEAERAVQERWEWEGKDVGELLRKAFGAADPLIACDAAGCIPYFTKFRAIDMMGLNDYHIARQRPPEFGRRALGHELGDGKYVLDREPDLILWSIPTGSNRPVSPSAVQMAQDRRFARDYRLVFLATSPPGRKVPVYCGLWLRVHSDRIGIRSEDGRLVLPGVLAASWLDRPATIDSQGRLGVLARVETPGQMKGMLLPPGRWRVTAESDVPVRIRLHAQDKVVEGVDELRVGAGRDAPGLAVDLELTPASTPEAHVRRLVLSPQPETGG